MKSAECLRQWSCVCAAKMEHISVCFSLYMCVYVRECVEVGVAPGGEGEYSSVWLNQTFLLSPAMMSDDE